MTSDVKARPSLFVVTGGPGSGKTTLVEALAADGVHTIPEAGRAVIKEQTRIGGTALPWIDPAAFAEAMLDRDLRSYRKAYAMAGLVVFDRGLPDLIGYLHLNKQTVPSKLLRAVQSLRYNQKVFIAPPWPEIFVHDAERHQSMQEAEATYDAMVSAYTDHGYELTQLPKCSVAERLAFVRTRISE